MYIFNVKRLDHICIGAIKVYYYYYYYYYYLTHVFYVDSVSVTFTY